MREQTTAERIKHTTTELSVAIKYAIAYGSSNSLMIKLVYIMWALSGGGVDSNFLLIHLEDG